MQFYRVFNCDAVDVPHVYAGVMDDAHSRAKLVLPRSAARIEQVEIPTDKNGVLALLNGNMPGADAPVLRTWALTDRGGLKEVANGE